MGITLICNTIESRLRCGPIRSGQENEGCGCLGSRLCSVSVVLHALFEKSTEPLGAGAVPLLRARNLQQASYYGERGFGWQLCKPLAPCVRQHHARFTAGNLDKASPMVAEHYVRALASKPDPGRCAACHKFMLRFSRRFY